MVRERVHQEFGLTEIRAGADPDLLVAKGAAIWARKLSLESEVRTALGTSNLAGIDWATTESRSLITRLVSSSGLNREMVSRLLQIGLESVTSRGYAIKCYRRAEDKHHLAYLVSAQEKLPFKSEPIAFAWNDEINSWHLKVFEDSAENRGTLVPDLARHVETVTGETNRTWAAGSGFYVQIEIGADQLIQMHAWHKDGDAPGGELRATVDPHANSRTQ
jgi:molecular chaperone DnaK (HSP70)